MYSIFLEEGAEGAGLGVYVWIVLGVFLVMIIIGALAKNNGWLKKETEPVKPAHDANGHSSHH